VKYRAGSAPVVGAWISSMASRHDSFFLGTRTPPALLGMGAGIGPWNNKLPRIHRCCEGRCVEERGRVVDAEAPSAITIAGRTQLWALLASSTGIHGAATWTPDDCILAIKRQRGGANALRVLVTQVAHESCVRAHWPSSAVASRGKVDGKHAAGNHSKRLTGRQRKVHNRLCRMVRVHTHHNGAVAEHAPSLIC